MNRAALPIPHVTERVQVPASSNLRARAGGAKAHVRAAVSIVVVHYETPVQLDDCLRSIAVASASLPVEVFVVDNASQSFAADTVSKALPEATVVRNPTNVGFSRAANQGLREASGRYLLLLNPDTVLAPDSLERMVEYMDAHPDVGLATARLILADGRLDLACRRSFPTPIRSFYRLTLLSRLFPKSRRFAQYNLTYLDEMAETEIDAPCGAFMIARSQIREQVGLLDEHYFMYGEDLDWSYRIKQAGWKVMYAPVTTVTHLKHASSRNSRPTTIHAFHNAMRLFYGRWYEARYPRVVSWLTYSAINIREALELASARISERRARA
jgi:N-acetylglucosaminyl-diphospho-decaprenol L-rhamnosyltransferase